MANTFVVICRGGAAADGSERREQAQLITPCAALATPRNMAPKPKHTIMCTRVESWLGGTSSSTRLCFSKRVLWRCRVLVSPPTQFGHSSPRAISKLRRRASVPNFELRVYHRNPSGVRLFAGAPSGTSSQTEKLPYLKSCIDDDPIDT